MAVDVCYGRKKFFPVASNSWLPVPSCRYHAERFVAFFIGTYSQSAESLGSYLRGADKSSV